MKYRIVDGKDKMSGEIYYVGQVSSETDGTVKWESIAFHSDKDKVKESIDKYDASKKYQYSIEEYIPREIK